MKDFIWTIVLVMGFEALIKMILLGQGKDLTSTPPCLAVDVVVLVALIIWGITVIK